MLTRRTLYAVTVALVASGLLAAQASAQGTEDLEKSLARDLTVAQKPMVDLGSGDPSKGIAVEAWLDRRELTYSIGQSLRVFVRPKQDAFITVLNVGSSGRTAILFPNHFQRETRVKAGDTLRIPDDRANWKIDVAGPAGIEVIKVIASSEPLRLAELQKLAGTSPQQPLLTLGRSAEEVGRDLVPQLTRPAADTKAPAFGVRTLLARVVDKAAGLPPAPAPVSIAQQFAAAYGLHVRSEKLVYKIGESVRIAVTAERDCRLTLINVGTSGQAIRLFPSAFQTDNLLLAGQVVSIPSPRSPVQLTARGPVGLEGVIATCRSPSAAPTAERSGENAFASAGDVRAIGRDLVPTASSGTDAATEHVFSGYFVIE